MVVIWTAYARGSATRRVVATAAIIASLAIMIALPMLLPNWNADVLTRFQNNNPAAFVDQSGRIDVKQHLSEMTPLYYREGPCSSVAVLEMNGIRSLVLNGRCVATEVESDLHHEMMLGHLPVLLHPNPKSAIVIGLGASITLGGVTAHPELEKITVVEIEPAVYGGAEYFSHVTGNTLSDPRLKKVVQDGRNYLLTTPDRFDVITADPIHPWSQGSTYLYTTEYCALAASRLTPGGIMCLWLPLYELSPDHLKSVVASFAENFKHTSIWQASADIVLIGSQETLRVEMSDLARRLNAPTVQRQLAPLGVGDPLSLIAECVMDEKAVAKFCEGATINTDDNLYLEFASPLTIGHPLVKPNAELIMSQRVNPAWLVADQVIESSPARETLEKYQQAKVDTVRVSLLWLGAGSDPPDAVVAEIIATLRGALTLAPGYGRAKVLLAEALALDGSRATASGNKEKALAALNEALELNPSQSEAHRMLGAALCDQRQFEQSVPHFEATLSRHPDDAATRYNYGVALLSLKRLEEAQRQFERSLALRPANANAHRLMGMTLLNLGRVASATSHFQEAVRLNPEDPQLKDTLGLALYMSGQKAAAVTELRQGVAQHPNDSRLHLSLAWILATCNEQGLRNGVEAERLARAALKMMSAEDPLALDALAAAMAEQGRFDEALATAGQASSLATQQGKTSQVAQIAKRIASYREHKAYHE
jgi:spermidine synthase/tetratricopeptide (TPR) repeat protein